MLVDVALPLPLEQTFTYRVPPALRRTAAVGRRHAVGERLLQRQRQGDVDEHSDGRRSMGDVRWRASGDALLRMLPTLQHTRRPVSPATPRPLFHGFARGRRAASSDCVAFVGGWEAFCRSSYPVKRGLTTLL